MMATREHGSNNAPKQLISSSKHQKNTDHKKAFLPWHSLHVPKETDFRGMTQEPFVDGTTLMLRNIPNKYTQTQLLEEIEVLGFAGTYDFFYLPMDKQNRSNVGYAFINFLDAASATKCWSVLTNYKFQRFQSKKICAVSPAHLQGFEKNYKHFQDCAVMNARKNEKYRPVVLRNYPQQAKHESFLETKHESPLEALSPCRVLELDKALFSGLLENHLNADLFNACHRKERLQEDGLHEVSQQHNADFFEPCYVPVEPLEIELHDNDNNFLIPAHWPKVGNFSTCRDVEPQRLSQPQEGLAPSTCLKEALSGLLQQNNIAYVEGQKKYPSLDLPIQTDVCLKHLPSLDLEHPEQTSGQGSDKLLAPPGLSLSFDSGHSTEDELLTTPGFSASFESDPEYVPQSPCKLQKPIGLYCDAPRCKESFEPDDITPRTKHSYLADCFGRAGTYSL
jgi:protein phosphatase 1 regulatory subunit 42